MINLEGFKTIRDFNDYLINKEGIVISLKGKQPRELKHKIIIQKGRKSAYSKVTLCKNNKKYDKYIHRLVAETYTQNPNDKPQINHKDGNKQNNSVNNLEWCSPSENLKHMHNELFDIPGTCIKPCELYYKDEYINTFDSIQLACEYASKKYNIGYTSLQKYHKTKGCKIIVK